MATVTNTSVSLLSYSYQVRQPERTIRYIQTHGRALLESFTSAIALHGPFLGLDIEWRPNWVKGAPERRVALIQLASRHEVLLFQIHRVGESVGLTSCVMELFLALVSCACPGQLPPVLAALLQDPDIKKVGVNIKGTSSLLVHTVLF
jgi:hypothetical protein